MRSACPDKDASPSSQNILHGDTHPTIARKHALCVCIIHSHNKPHKDKSHWAKRRSMGNKAVISKELILEASYKLVLESGPANLSIRSVAKACGVSVGSIYNYYPTKAMLVADAVGMFWQTSLSKEMFVASSGEDFITFCERLMHDLEHTIEAFRKSWLNELAALDPESRKEVRMRENAAFAHIKRGLTVAIEHDEYINLDALSSCGIQQGNNPAELLATLVWDVMVASLQNNDAAYRPLFALMRATLYKN